MTTETEPTIEFNPRVNALWRAALSYTQMTPDDGLRFAIRTALKVGPTGPCDRSLVPAIIFEDHRLEAVHAG